MQTFLKHRFGGNFQVSGQLHSQLNRSDLTVQELFAIPNIIGDIKQNIQLFLTFCRKRKQFTTQMLQLCLNTSYQTLQLQKNKLVAHYTAELLSCDEDALSEFLFVHKQVTENSNNQEVCQKIQQQIVDNIVLDAQRLFNDDDNLQDLTTWKKESDVFERYQLVKLTLKILQNPEKNQTCLGFLNKIYSSLIRRQASQFLEFLSCHKNYITLMIDGIKFYAIGNLLTLILSSEDKTGKYRYQNFKMQIFQQLLQKSIQNIANRQNFQGILITIQQILNTTKQSYYQYFEDFKRCANILVCEETLKKFIQFVKTGQGNTFINAISYLQLILKRINSQSDDNQHDYYRQNQTGPSMKFQYHFIFNQIDSLAKIAKNIVSNNYLPTTRISYFSFLIQLIKNSNYQQDQQLALQYFKTFTELLSAQKSHGMVKNYLYQIVNLKISKMSPQNVKKAVQWFYYQSNQTIKGQLRNLNPFEKLQKINCNQTSCFISKILHSFKQKSPLFFQSLAQEEAQKANTIYNKYQIKLAKQEQAPIKTVLNDDFKLQLPIASLRKNRQKQKDEGQSKNSTNIPTLKLPESSNQNKIIIQQQEVKTLEINQFSRQFIIEDLKNTKIQLPEKFKNNENKINYTLPPPKLQKLAFSVQLQANTQIKVEQVKFFVKHLMLF